MRSFIILSIILVSIFISGCGPAPETSNTPSNTAAGTTPVSTTGTTLKSTTTAVPKPVPSLKLESYNGGFFTLNKPVGWDVVTAGGCSTFAFYAADKNNPANRIFYMGEVGPVYLAESQKKVDQNYMDMGGFKVTWFEMPVIDPLTPENFLVNYHLVAETTIAQAFMPGLPELQDVEIISMAEETSFIFSGQTKTIRALFKQGGQLGEGLFFITVAPLIPLTGMPSGGIGYCFCFTGITSVRADFKFYEEKLYESMNSLKFSQAYIDDCLAAQKRQGAALVDLGKTLSRTSDIIMETWENRNRSDDIISERRSDAMLGYERLYDPETGTVYEAPLGFYDNYDTNRDKYRMDNLQTLPEDDWDLWTAPTEPVTEID